MVVLVADGMMAYTVDGEPRLSGVRVGPLEDVPMGDDEYHRSLRRLCLRDIGESRKP
jgi:hypothetical protein